MKRKNKKERSDKRRRFTSDIEDEDEIYYTKNSEKGKEEEDNTESDDINSSNFIDSSRNENELFNNTENKNIDEQDNILNDNNLNKTTQEVSLNNDLLNEGQNSQVKSILNEGQNSQKKSIDNFEVMEEDNKSNDINSNPNNEKNDNDNNSDSSDSDEDSTINDAEEEPKINRMISNSSIENISEIGIIESVELRNFMCHKSLKVDFGPRINFIIGKNGSGKSAILTAITVCLGGKAIITQRATSLKELIKEGEKKGSVTVKIHNKGMDAYRSDIYGDQIIIEREFGKDGRNEYRIKNSKGEIVSKSRKKLDHILDYMFIQIDNPLIILNQDLARQFLSSNSPNEKYNYFLKGTQLSQIYEDLELLREKINKIENIIKINIETLRDKEKLIKRKQLELNNISSAQDLVIRSEEIKKQLAWTKVIELEENIASEEENYENESKIYTSEVDKVNEIKKKLEPFYKEIEVNNEKMKKLLEKQESINTKKKNMENNLKEVEKKHFKYEKDNKKIEIEMNQLLNKKKEFERKIYQDKEKIENMNSNERRKQEIEIESLDNEINELNKNISDINNNLDNNNTEISQVIMEQEKYEKELKSLNSEINSLTSNINELISQKENKVIAFHINYPEILKTIEEYDKAGKWKEGKPIGPFGMYISIKMEYKEWWKIIESILNKYLSSIGVFSYHDRKLMQSILTKYECSAFVYICNKRNIDFSKGEPEKKYLTVLRAIECNNYIVVQQLVVNAKIEQIILIKSRKEANIVMSTGPNKGFPINVKECYTIDGYKVGYKGGYGTFSLNLTNEPQKLSIDVNEAINENQSKINNLNITQEKIKENILNCKSSISNFQTMKRKLKNLLEKFQKEIRHRENLKTQIQEEMEERTLEDISTIEKKLSSVNYQIDILEKQRSELHKQIEMLTNEKDKLNNEINEIDCNININNEDIEKLKNEISDIRERRIKSLDETLKNYTSKMESQYQICQDLGKKIKKMRLSLEKERKLSLEYCERIEVEKSKYELENELNAINHQIQINKNYDPKTLNLNIEKLLDLVEEFKNSKEKIKKLNDLVDKLKDCMNIRMNGWQLFKIVVTARAKCLFTDLLSRRGYSGKMDIDHRKQQLTLNVQVEDQALVSVSGNESYENDPKLLSGGEKSFSTICFLLSLWETVSCPIRGLDEFDVFMDAVNRRISMKMLIEYAKDTSNQYIIITPQDISNIQEFELDDLKIIRMDDPKRKK